MAAAWKIYLALILMTVTNDLCSWNLEIDHIHAYRCCITYFNLCQQLELWLLCESLILCTSDLKFLPRTEWMNEWMNDSVVNVFVKLFVTARSIQNATHTEAVYYDAVSPLQSCSLFFVHIYFHLKCNLLSSHPSSLYVSAALVQ
jgi:hypothetical protein